jgi:fumarylacetoacetate (FAA) hydrolase
MIETINNGQPTTGFMQYGSKVRIEMLNEDGKSIFGAIEQEVASS